MLDIPLLCIDAGHSDDFHPWAEVSAGRHILADVHRAAQFSESADPLLRRQTGVTVLRHAVSCLQNNKTLSLTALGLTDDKAPYLGWSYFYCKVNDW